MKLFSRHTFRNAIIKKTGQITQYIKGSTNNNVDKQAISTTSNIWSGMNKEKVL